MNTTFDEHNPQAIGRRPLDEAAGPRPRDLPEPIYERPSFLKSRARQLMRRAAYLAGADASTLGEDYQRRRTCRIARLRNTADQLMKERTEKLVDLERAATRPATQYTAAARGARSEEPPQQFVRALLRTLLELDVPPVLANELIST